MSDSAYAIVASIHFSFHRLVSSFCPDTGTHIQVLMYLHTSILVVTQWAQMALQSGIRFLGTHIARRVLMQLVANPAL